MSALSITEPLALEQDARETIRTIRYALDDLSATLERLRQLRAVEADPAPGERRLIVEDTGCNRWEVTCDD